MNPSVNDFVIVRAYWELKRTNRATLRVVRSLPELMGIPICEGQDNLNAVYLTPAARVTGKDGEITH